MPAKPSAQELETYVAIWSKAVDTQMHFNEMSVKSRQLGLAFAAAALGLAIVLLVNQKEYVVQLGNFQLHGSVLVALGAAAAMFFVRQLDLGVYHRMLRGAVTFGEDFEQQYMKRIFELEKGMTQAISHFSRHSDAKANKGPAGRYVYTGTSLRSAEVKIKKFYKGVIFTLAGLTIGLFLVTNWKPIANLFGATP